MKVLHDIISNARMEDIRGVARAMDALREDLQTLIDYETTQERRTILRKIKADLGDSERSLRRLFS